MERIVEICCGSYYDALQAEYGGARRIELNSALHLGFEFRYFSKNALTILNYG